MGNGFRFDLIPPGSGVVCALSGGADSMYLLCRLLEGRARYGWTVAAAHLNHGLRQTAARDEEFVLAFCRMQDISLTVGHADVAGYAAGEGLSVEEAGRILRYAFLEETARALGPDAVIATGHHAGDNAETVLMNLIRGAGLKGLTGIPERRDNIVRPMLTVSRAEIEAYLEEKNVPHVEDETNLELDYTRNRVRHQLLPLLEELNPQAAAHIAASARRLAEDEAELSRQAALAAEQGLDIPEGAAIPVRVLREAPRPIALRACAMLLDRAGLGGGAVHLDKIMELAGGDDPSARIGVPGGSVRRQYDLLVFSAAPLPLPPAAVELGREPRVSRWGSWTIACRQAVCPEKAYISPQEFYLKPGNYLVRSRREGDRITLGRRPAKTVKKLMIEGRVPAAQRDRVPVLDLEGRAAAVGGFGPERECLAVPGGPALHIILKAEENERCIKM